MKNHLLLLAFTLIALSVCGQNGAPPIAGARSLGMGGAGVTFSDIHAAWSNPAGLADLPAPWAAAAFGQQPFLLGEIRQLGAAAAMRGKSSALGLTLGYFGFEQYNEQRIGLAYSRRLFSRLSLGLQLLAVSTRIPEYGNKIVPTFELGLLGKASEQVQIGFRIFSPARIEVLDGEYLPTILQLGLSYRPAEQLLLLAELEKDVLFPLRVRAGIEYQLAEILSLRLGAATRPVLVSFGAGIRLAKTIRVDVGASYHQSLGFTPGLSLVFQ